MRVFAIVQRMHAGAGQSLNSVSHWQAALRKHRRAYPAPLAIAGDAPGVVCTFSDDRARNTGCAGFGGEAKEASTGRRLTEPGQRVTVENVVLFLGVSG